MAVELATAYVSILPSTRGMGKALASQLNSELAPAGKKAGAGLGAGVAAGAKRLMKAGALGAVALSAFTVKKGLDRALQIEQAEAKLRGLGHSAQSVTKVMDSALAAVKGTSYGLGDAATIAASAVAAGVKPGKELTAYLTQVADASTIAGVGLAEMGDITNKVTATGKVYTRNLNQLSERGIPIFQWLADEYGVTQAALSEMVSKGKVDSATFNKVIRENIGGAALESGRTTQGAFQNTVAAVGRLGESLVGGVLPQIRGGFNGLIGAIDGLGPAAEGVGSAIGKTISSIADWVTTSEPLRGVLSGLKDLAFGLWENVAALFDAFGGGRGATAGITGALDGVLAVAEPLVRVMADNTEWVVAIAAAYSGWKAVSWAADLTKLAVAWGAETNAKLASSWASVKSLAETGALMAMYGWDAVKKIGAATSAWILNTAQMTANYLGAKAIRAFWAAGWMLGQIGVIARSTGAWIANTAAMIAQKSATLLAAGAAKVMAGAQKVLNLVMSANPIGLLVAALALLVGGLILAYKKSETFRRIVDACWSGIRKAVSVAWNQVLKPALSWIWEFTKKRLIPIFQTYVKIVVAVWSAIGRAIKWTWSSILKPVLVNYLIPTVKRVWAAFQTARDITKRALSAIGAAAKWVWENVIKKAFNAIRAGVSRVADAFTKAKNLIRTVWDQIKGIIKRPIVGAIKIINSVLISPINAVAKKLGKKGDLITPIDTSGFERGGYTGRKPRRKVAGVVHGDEYVHRSWARRRLEAARPGGLDYMNKTGRWPGYVRGGRVLPLAGASFSTYPGHTGVDLNAPNDEGKPVLAAAPGTVAKVVSLTGSYGKHIWVNHGNGISAIYAHLSRFTARRGQRLAAGEQLGNVGSTGNSTGPHLHFEVRPGGTYASSLAFLKGASSMFGGVSANGTGQAEGDNWIARIVKATKTLKRKLADLGGGMGDLIRGAAGKLGSAASDWVKSGVKKFFGAVGRFLTGGGGDLTGKATTPGGAKAAAKGALGDFGWGTSQWSALERLWTKESGWNYRAQNPTSSAYGIPQALPGSKMASAGSDWRTNPITQIKWGLGYIRDRYGSPAKAWDHSVRTGWYDAGGWLQPGETLARNATGSPEPVFTARQWSILKRFLPTSRTQQPTLSQLEKAISRILTKHDRRTRRDRGIRSTARRTGVDARFAESVTRSQWQLLKKWVPKLAKKIDKPSSLKDANKYLRAIERQYGKRSAEAKQARQLQAQARYGGQYSWANKMRLRDLMPATGRAGTAANAATQVQALVTKVFGPHSPITRQVTKLATKIKNTVTTITGLNTKLGELKTAQSELASSIAENFRADAFGSGLDNLRLVLAANTNDAKAFGAALKRATSKGLSGGLLKALAASGDVQTAREIANLSAAQIAALEKQWNQREKTTAKIGAQAAQAAYGPDIAALRRTIATQNRVLRSLRRDLREATFQGTKAGIRGTTRTAKAKKKVKG